MRGEISRRGHRIGDVAGVVFDGDLMRFTTNASLAFTRYEVRLPGSADRSVLVVSLARDGRGPQGEAAPGCTRVTAIRAVEPTARVTT